ncbi:ABC transporter substrate-binding protein [Paracoccus chinensis]|uniref:Putative spermidine/putrescine transport system substrate-binding protein n=1 Tax=Paracoccus chinensis TaxID=525640 RepID=A0A1G9LF18_9RHOB|nr:ABC transporter substrate-binding protein [Paracoccus chinensis]SDL60115.1 putative spermidine/putrescine transport system substrate-binding protein [Paracoccus chinensis]
MRLAICSVSFTALVLSAGSAMAQQSTLYVAGYGGTFEQIMRSKVIPKFEQEHGVKIEYVAGNSTDSLAKLQAQKGNQQIDVAILDDGPMYQAIELGFCAPIEGLDKSNLFEQALYPEDKAVATGIVATGLFYNTEYFEKQGWEPPTSWNDLKDPRYKGMIVIPPINNTYGLYTLVQFARMNGGSEKDIEPGFATMIDEVNANVLAYEPSPGKMTELFQSGQAVLGVWGSSRVQALADTGFPAAFVYPEEGAVTLLASACPVAKEGASPLASAFVNALLDPEVQSTMAVEYGYGPVHKQVEVPEEMKATMPTGERIAEMYNSDWVTINQNREDWTKRWNREVER